MDGGGPPRPRAAGGSLRRLRQAHPQAPTTRPAPPAAAPVPPLVAHPAGRPTVGVAFGGGSARGIAHVGVIRWLEEHRIPIDAAAGTSMGGLIGGAYASGMEAAELKAFIMGLDWDQLFGASSFAYKNIRRKADARAYPSRLEFGLKGGIVPPAALNNGESVELLLGRIAAPYWGIKDFDELPTPFRTVAVDLLSAQPVVMRSGSLADAMRATMSLPLIFPPIEVDGQILIDGATMNNVPADVVKAMGADKVVAISVGDLADREGLSYTMFGVAGNTIDAMMRASTRRALASADVLVHVPLDEYRLARLAARLRSHGRGLQGRREHAREVAAPGRQRSRLRGVAPRTPGAAQNRAARAGLPRSRRVRRQRQEAPEHAAGASRRETPRRERRSRRTSRRSPAWIGTRR